MPKDLTISLNCLASKSEICPKQYAVTLLDKLRNTTSNGKDFFVLNEKLISYGDAITQMGKPSTEKQ